MTRSLVICRNTFLLASFFATASSFSIHIGQSIVETNLLKPIHTSTHQREGSRAKRKRIILSESQLSDFTSWLRLSDRFERWKFLQDLFDGDLKAQDVNQVLYYTLDGFVKFPRPVYKDDDDESEETGSPKLSSATKDLIESLLESSEESVDALQDPDCGPGNAAVLDTLQQLLPDEAEDEDGFKSTWDSVIEIHGRELVKVCEENATPEWNARCTIGRILIYYDFLQYGMVDAPFQ